MAILEIPFVGLSLLERSAGGAILAKGGAYIAGTYISAGVVEAFSTASAVLASMGSAAAGAAFSPIVASGAVLTVAAAGAYCYFYGIPAPVAAALSKAGLGTAAKKGLAISVPKLAVALVLLGGAGFVSYRLYETNKAAKHAAQSEATQTDGRATAEAAFGQGGWPRFGATLWSDLSEAAERAAGLAEEAIEALSKAGGSVAAAVSSSANGAYMAAARAGPDGAGLISRWIERLRRRLPI